MQGDQCQHQERPVLVAFFAALAALPMTEIGITEDMADPSFQPAAFFAVRPIAPDGFDPEGFDPGELVVKMVNIRRHFGGFDRSDLVRAKLRCQLDPPIALRQPDKFLVGQQHGAQAAVLGNEDLVADRGILISAKIFESAAAVTVVVIGGARLFRAFRKDWALERRTVRLNREGFR